MLKSSSLRTPLKRARGLGSGHAGTHHFWLQRASAVALVPLSLWFVAGLFSCVAQGSREAVGEWLAHPLSALALTALIVALFLHARMGVQVIIEDYVKTDNRKIILLLLLSALTIIFGAMALMAIAKLHFLGM